MPKPYDVSDVEVVPSPSDGVPSVSGSALETIPQGTRRRFSPSEKLRIVKAADAAKGERGGLQAFLRQEGLYSSQLATWKLQFGAQGVSGLTSRKPGRIPKLDAKDRQLLVAKKELEATQRKLRVAHALIELQKKAHDLLGLALPAGLEGV